MYTKSKVVQDDQYYINSTLILNQKKLQHLKTTILSYLWCQRSHCSDGFLYKLKQIFAQDHSTCHIVIQHKIYIPQDLRKEPNPSSIL